MQLHTLGWLLPEAAARWAAMKTMMIQRCIRLTCSTALALLSLSFGGSTDLLTT
jgi:hypothetical protein